MGGGVVRVTWWDGSGDSREEALQQDIFDP